MKGIDKGKLGKSMVPNTVKQPTPDPNREESKEQTTIQPARKQSTNLQKSVIIPNVSDLNSPIKKCNLIVLKTKSNQFFPRNTYYSS